MKTWLKKLGSKIRDQRGTTLAELMAAVTVMALVVPGLIAAFNVFIHVPAQGTAVLSSIQSVSYTSDWITKDSSRAQSVIPTPALPDYPAPPYYVVFKYTDAAGEHVIDYKWVGTNNKWNENENTIVREETVGGTTTTFTVATGIEKYDRADLDVVTIKSGQAPTTWMLTGNLLSTHYAGADPREKEASPYNVLRGAGDEEEGGQAVDYSLLYLGTGSMVVNGWTLYFRNLHSNGFVQFEGVGSHISGDMSAVSDISFNGGTNNVSGSILANGLVSGNSITSVGGDIRAGEIQIGSSGNRVYRNLYANGNIGISGNGQIVGDMDAGTPIPGHIKSLGQITISGNGHVVYGSVLQKVGTPDIGTSTVYGEHRQAVNDDELLPLPLPTLDTQPSPITTTIQKIVDAARDEGTLREFTDNADLTKDPNNKDDVYDKDIWTNKNNRGELVDGVFYAPNGTLSIDIDGKANGVKNAVSGKVTFIAQQIQLTQTDSGFNGDPSYKLHSYGTKGILFWATYSGNKAIWLSGLNGVSLQGIAYAENGDVQMVGKTPESEFIMSTGSSLIGQMLTLQSQGTLKFTNISLSPTQGPIGTEVTVTGLGFHSDSNIDLFFGTDEPDDWPLLIETDAQGRFTDTFTVPDWATPDKWYTVKVEDEEGNYATASFKVTP